MLGEDVWCCPDTGNTQHTHFRLEILILSQRLSHHPTCNFTVISSRLGNAFSWRSSFHRMTFLFFTFIFCTPKWWIYLVWSRAVSWWAGDHRQGLKAVKQRKSKASRRATGQPKEKWVLYEPRQEDDYFCYLPQKWIPVGLYMFNKCTDQLQESRARDVIPTAWGKLPFRWSLKKSINGSWILWFVIRSQTSNMIQKEGSDSKLSC